GDPLSKNREFEKDSFFFSRLEEEFLISHGRREMSDYAVKNYNGKEKFYNNSHISPTAY
ncbi:unnamed protein product, partial [Arabidopsis halleri]